MARTGRPRKPRSLKVVPGNFPQKGKDEKKNDTGKRVLTLETPEKPKHLNEAEGAIWDRLVTALAKIGTLQKVDEGTLSAYCKVYARYQEADQEIRNEGMFYWTDGRQGRHRKVNPAVGVMERCEQRLKQLATEFGMTPSSRKAMGYDPTQLFLPFDHKPENDDPTKGLL
ncbi:MAG: phage terminase small subunit P27 family [Alphaproteobacteria bacterium]